MNYTGLVRVITTCLNYAYQLYLSSRQPIRYIMSNPPPVLDTQSIDLENSQLGLQQALVSLRNSNRMAAEMYWAMNRAQQNLQDVHVLTTSLIQTTRLSSLRSQIEEASVAGDHFDALSVASTASCPPGLEKFKPAKNPGSRRRTKGARRGPVQLEGRQFLD